ncbi:hypothetical protein CDAR_189041 [Caerostris darwini]|uniref:Maturase K n=1 Tax=Caerostris darwini TaxID=1538125 RepID=A0AAV4SQX6_9ARAC|nr:hypothetical protein CDAR_189041 [Caerostris darwini]
MLLYKYGLEPRFSRIWNSSAHVDGNKRDVPPAGIGRDLFIREFGTFYLATGQDLDEFQSDSVDASNLLFFSLQKEYTELFCAGIEMWLQPTTKRTGHLLTSRFRLIGHLLISRFRLTGHLLTSRFRLIGRLLTSRLTGHLLTSLFRLIGRLLTSRPTGRLLTSVYNWCRPVSFRFGPAVPTYKIPRENPLSKLSSILYQRL